LEVDVDVLGLRHLARVQLRTFRYRLFSIPSPGNNNVILAIG